MPQIVTAHWEQDNGLVYVPFGFTPDYVMLVDFHTNTNIVLYHWFSTMETDQATGKQEGISVTEGATANLADSGGIVSYDDSAAGPTVQAWTEARSTAATARTATAAGTFIKPATSSKGDKSAIFECVTAGTGAATEPDWDDDAPGIGDQLTDNSTVWERVNEALVIKGYQGIRIAAALQNNGREMYALAIQADRDVDWKDVDGWTSSIASVDQM